MSCAKATIKTTLSRSNETNDDLSGLEVVSLVIKKYFNEDAKPLWAWGTTACSLKTADRCAVSRVRGHR
jgi:hypothetical protein